MPAQEYRSSAATRYGFLRNGKRDNHNIVSFEKMQRWQREFFAMLSGIDSAEGEKRKEQRMRKTVRDIMTAEVTTLGRNDSLQVVKDIMTLGRVRHFPVLDDGKVIGVVSQRDLYKASLGSVMKYGEKAQRAFLEGIAVKEVMNEPVITIAPHASVQDAARLMLEKKIGCLPVLEGSTLVGIVTETDMLKLVVAM
jgi:CBS domain-containing protein